MKTSKYFTRTTLMLKSLNIRTKKETENKTTNELIHPRFETTTTATLDKKEDTNSLLFLMYSKENETLFI